MKIGRNKFTAAIKVFMLFIINIAILPIQVEASDNDMQARYKRAQDLVIDVYPSDGPVLNATICPTRVKNNDNFWYKRQLKNGYEYRLIDVRKKTNKAAFDHEDLAKALGKATDKDIQPHALPITADEHVGSYRLLVIDIATGTIAEPAHPHLTHANNGGGFFEGGLGWWAQDSKHAYFIEQQCGDQRVRVMEFDVETGSTSVLFTETTDTYFKFTPDSEKPPMFRILPETEELIWFSERSGWGHLYLIDMKTGKEKNAITRDDWLVRNIIHVDAERRELLIQTSGRVPGRNPYYRDIALVNMDAGKLTDLVTSNHDYNIFAGNMFSDVPEDMRAVSRGGQYFVATRSRINDVLVSFLYERNGKKLMAVETADISALPKGRQWPGPVKLKAADGKTDTFRPSDFDPTQKYPVLEYTFCAAPETLSSLVGSFASNDTGSRLYMLPVPMQRLASLSLWLMAVVGPSEARNFRFTATA